MFAELENGGTVVQTMGSGLRLEVQFKTEVENVTTDNC